MYSGIKQFDCSKEEDQKGCLNGINGAIFWVFPMPYCRHPSSRPSEGIGMSVMMNGTVRFEGYSQYHFQQEMVSCLAGLVAGKR